MILKTRRATFLNGPMPTGVKIPKVEGGTHGIEPCSLDEGHQRLIRAWDKLEKSPPTEPHLIFGPLSQEDWIKMHLRHAELHLSFLHP